MGIFKHYVHVRAFCVYYYLAFLKSSFKYICTFLEDGYNILLQLSAAAVYGYFVAKEDMRGGGIVIFHMNILRHNVCIGLWNI